MTPGRLRESVGILILAAISLAAMAAPASAVVTETAGGPVSYLPLNGAVPGAASPLRAAEPTPSPPLEYHGGPVMHSHEAFAIFWAPGGPSQFPSGYIEGIEKYLEDVAEDSGKPTNVYSVSAQYTETGGAHATYSDSFGGSVVDEHAYPTSGTCPPYEGFTGVDYTSCISDEKMAEEVNVEVAAKGWPHGLGSEYYVVLPPHIGSCFGLTANSGCFDKVFCAYHNFTESPESIYANISYSPGDVFGCGVGEYPNGHANGNLDDTLSSLSHEANESITDPTLEAWFDSEGFENGDECRNTEDDYGLPLGGGSETLFNQEIGTGHYYLQREWSNDTEDCEQRVDPAIPLIADPGEVTINQSVSFNSSGTTPGAGGISSRSWDFGDGGTSTATNPSHTFASLGDFTVKLTVTDDGGFTYSTEREVEVLPPAQPPEVITSAATGVTDAVATLNGSVNPKGRNTTYHFEYGKTTGYGSSTSVTSAGNGSASVPVAAEIEELDPSTTYHFRLSATNSAGTITGGDQTLTTSAGQPPEVTTSSATAVTDVAGTLHGTVNPAGHGTTYHFEYGTTTAYGNVTSSSSAGSGATPVEVSTRIEGLVPSTTYHFRLSAASSAGTVSTPDGTFTTTPAPPITPSPAPILILPPLTKGSAVAGGSAAVKGGVAFLKLSCRGTGACKGTLELLVRVTTHKHGATHSKVQSIGRATFSLGADASAKVGVRLTNLGKGLVDAAGKKGLRATLSGSGITGRSLLLKKS